MSTRARSCALAWPVRRTAHVHACARERACLLRCTCACATAVCACVRARARARKRARASACACARVCGRASARVGVFMCVRARASMRGGGLVSAHTSARARERRSEGGEGGGACTSAHARVLAHASERACSCALARADEYDEFRARFRAGGVRASVRACACAAAPSACPVAQVSGTACLCLRACVHAYA